jgi:hypothetical protein
MLEAVSEHGSAKPDWLPRSVPRDCGEAHGGFNGNIEALDHFKLVCQFRDQHLDCIYRDLGK